MVDYARLTESAPDIAVMPESMSDIDFGALVDSAPSFESEEELPTVDYAGLVKTAPEVTPEEAEGIDYASLLENAPQISQPRQPSPALAIPQGIKQFKKPVSELNPLQKFGRAFGRGGEQVGADIAAGRAIVGADGKLPEIIGDPISAVKEGFFDDLTEEDIIRIEPHIQKQIKLQQIEADDPIKGSNWLATGVYQAANMLGGMWKTYSKSWDDALAGGVAGSVIPGAGTLSGAGLGLTLGSAKEWYFQGLGQMYKDMQAEGLDPESSKNAAMAMAVPYAATEFLFTKMPFVRSFFKPIGKVGKRTLAKGASAIALNVLRQHGINSLGEISEEGIQQVTNDIATNMARYMDTQKTGTSRKAIQAKEMFTNSMTTMLQSALPIALTGAPSVALRGIEAASDYQQFKAKEATTADGIKQNLIKDFGDDAVKQINDKTVEATLPDGRKIRVELVAGVEDLAVENPVAWLESARQASTQAGSEVESALVQANGNKADAIAVLKQLGYGDSGVNQQDVSIKDEAGNDVKVASLIQLIEGTATAGTLAHEKWHAVKALAGVTTEQEAQLTDTFGNEEKQATAFAQFAETNPVMRKISDFIRGILRMLRISDTETDVEIGERIREQLLNSLNVVREGVSDNIDVVSEQQIEPLAREEEAATPQESEGVIVPPAPEGITEEAGTELEEGDFVFHRGADPRLADNIVLAADDRESITHFGEDEFAIPTSALMAMPQWVQDYADDYSRNQLGDDFDRFLPPKADPENIVNSADVWDDQDFVSTFFSDNESELLELRDKGIFGFKTQDGAVLFPGEDMPDFKVGVEPEKVAATEATPEIVKIKGVRGDTYEVIGRETDTLEDGTIEKMVELRNTKTDEVIFEQEQDISPVTEAKKKAVKTEPKTLSGEDMADQMEQTIGVEALSRENPSTGGVLATRDIAEVQNVRDNYAGSTFTLTSIDPQAVKIHPSEIFDSNKKQIIEKGIANVPPPVVERQADGTTFVKIDGAHRIAAAQELGRKKIKAYVVDVADKFKPGQEEKAAARQEASKRKDIDLSELEDLPEFDKEGVRFEVKKISAGHYKVETSAGVADIQFVDDAQEAGRTKGWLYTQPGDTEPTEVFQTLKEAIDTATGFAEAQTPIEGEGVVGARTTPSISQQATELRKEADETAKTMKKASSQFSVTKKVGKDTLRDVNGFQKFFYKFLAFGEAFGRHPETGQKAMAIRHRIATAAKRAQLIVSNALEALKVGTMAGDYNISYALEEKGGRAKLDDRQKKIYDALAALRDTITVQQKKAGVLDKGWLEGTIATLKTQQKTLEGKIFASQKIQGAIDSAELMQLTFSKQDSFERQDQIGKLQSEIRQIRAQEVTDQEKLEQTKRELESLEKFEGYVPHKVVARAVLKAIYEQANNERRITLSKNLEEFHRQRKGYATLREYVEGFTNPTTGKHVDGFLTTDELDPAIMTMQMLSDGMTKIAIKEFVDYGFKAGLALDEKNAKTAGPDWRVPADYNINIRGLENVKLHTIFGNALKELAGADPVPRTTFDKMLAITKVGQFFVPGIIWTYNVMQSYQRGIGSWNPITAIRTFKQAKDIYFSGGSVYQNLLSLGLIQAPGLPTQATNDQIFKTASRQLRTDINKSRQFGERLIQAQPRGVREVLKDLKANPKTALPTFVNGVMIPYRAISAMTWAGDGIQRIQSYLLLKERFPNMTDARAAEIAAKAHGAYALLSTKYQRLASRIFFVHTFRILMPWEVGKSMWSAPKMAYDMMRKRTVNQDEWRLNSRAFITTVMTPIAIASAMAANGWEPDEEGLPEWVKAMTAGKIPIGMPFPTYKNHWKYKKTITNPEGVKKELVVGVNNIINMPLKWISRFTKERPERLDDLTYHLFNLVKWEVNPMYRIVFDVVTNESSMGGNRPIRREDPIYKQAASVAQYAFGNTFRMYGEMLKGGEGTAYKREVKNDLEGSLNMLEKVMLGYYTGYTKIGKFNPANVGYVYSRAERRRRLGFALDALKSAVAKEKGVIKREQKDRPDELRRRTREMNLIHRQRKQRLAAIFLGGNVEKI